MNGKPISDKDRSTRTNEQLIQNINRSIRTDFGGQKDKAGLVVKKMEKLGYSINKNQAEGIITLFKEQVEGVRKRTSHDRRELLNRFREEVEETEEE